MYIGECHEKRQDCTLVTCPKYTSLNLNLKAIELWAIKIHLIEFHKYFKEERRPQNKSSDLLNLSVYFYAFLE
jgi:hypothetical protein